jgi:hypothetical protein
LMPSSVPSMSYLVVYSMPMKPLYLPSLIRDNILNQAASSLLLIRDQNPSELRTLLPSYLAFLILDNILVQ